ncbi:MAG: hypothetical protein IT317_06815 [Anaerolineales bacterium]|nr:hypothetical protein [Anaerolineales bacterium]
MPELRYGTDLSIAGPWQLDSQQLIELNVILDEAWTRLHLGWQNEVNKEVQRRLSDYEKMLAEYGKTATAEELAARETEYRKDVVRFVSPNRNTKIRFRTKEVFDCATIAEAIRERSTLDKTPAGFVTSMEIGKLRCKVSLNDSHIYASSTLDIQVSPEESSEAKELFVALRNWAIRNQPSSLLRWWARVGGATLFWALALSVWGLFVIWIAVTLSTTSAAKSRARDLLDFGISDSNMAEAVELLLILQVDYLPGTTPRDVSVPIWLKAYSFGGLVAVVLLWYKPDVELGIGMGEQRIATRRRWQSLVLKALPAAIFGTIVAPLIYEWFRIAFIGIP